MWTLYASYAVGKRLYSQLFNLAPALAFGEISLNSAMVLRSGLVFFTDQEARVRQVLVRRHFQVVRRRLVLVDAPGQVEGGAVAGAQEAALPVVRQRGLRAGLELVAGRAAQVRADTHQDQDLRLDRAVLVLAVLGDRVGGALGIRVGDLVVRLLQRG